MENFIQNYMRDIQYKKVDDGYDLYLPFMLFNDETTISLHLKKHKDGYWEIDDKGNTFRYLDNMDVNIKDYEWKIELICRYFSLTIKDGVVKGVVGFNLGLELLYETYSKENPQAVVSGFSRGSDLTYVQLHNFLQGLSNLSMIKFLE